ncbi:MAG: hypothetical protein NWQ12_02085 [Candidatus Nanopelagicales bacterium]|nr:hypothetical protein [Candidatus Nanopelagicales bacterium]
MTGAQFLVELRRRRGVKQRRRESKGVNGFRDSGVVVLAAGVDAAAISVYNRPTTSSPWSC